MCIQRPTPFGVEEVWELREPLFFPNFSGTLLGKQIKKLTTTSKKPRASMSLSYGGHRPFKELSLVLLLSLAPRWARDVVHPGTSGRGLLEWAWPVVVGVASRRDLGLGEGEGGALPALTPSFPLPRSYRCLPEL